MLEIKDLVIFLDKIHLFNGLDEKQLASIALKVEEREYPKGKVIFKSGDKPDGFYLVYKGRVRVTLTQFDGTEKQLSLMYASDYFGEEALFENRNRSATVTAQETTTLLFIPRAAFESILKQYEVLRPNFEVSIQSRKLARSTNFKWLGKNEVIYFIARRHKFRLFVALVKPVLATLVPLGLLFLGMLTAATTPFALSIVGFVFVLGWIIWSAIDWSNDYFIVTNQRVVWLEKIIFLHDSREEAPLGTILSVGVETDYFGKLLGFGNVIVRTFVGKLEFDNVEHATQAADMIREYWERTKAITTRSQMDVMKDTIKQKLGLPIQKRQVELAPVVAVDEEKVLSTPLWLLALSRLFQLRLEDGGKVIYHKHWLILIRRAWRPLALTLMVLGIFFWRIYLLATSTELSFIRQNASGGYSPDTIVVLMLLLMLPVGFWLWYEFTDWQNDTFMITNDEIFDIDRKPFGTEEKRSAQIEAILSTSYKRNGFIAYIFNYGTVYITVGGTQMAFEDVIDPAAVQADINRRRSARMAKKNEDAGKEDRERFATWIAAYHQNASEFNKPITAPAEAKKEEDSKINPFSAAAKESQELEDLPLGGEEGYGDDYSGEEGFDGEMDYDGGGDYSGEF